MTAFGPLAERLSGELKQGDAVHCSGRLQLNRWRKDGVEKVNLQMVAWHCEAAAIGRNKPKRSQPAANDADPTGRRASVLSA